MFLHLIVDRIQNKFYKRFFQAQITRSFLPRTNGDQKVVLFLAIQACKIYCRIIYYTYVEFRIKLCRSIKFNLSRPTSRKFQLSLSVTTYNNLALNETCLNELQRLRIYLYNEN